MTGPRIGQSVHYRSWGSAGGKFPPACRAALVTEVSDKRADGEEIGLAAINPTGMFFDRQVRHDENKAPGTWHYPCVVKESDD